MSEVTEKAVITQDFLDKCKTLTFVVCLEY